MSIFNAGQPPIADGHGGIVTMVEASTFCLSDQLGDIHAGTSQGLFYRDARVLARWELRLDGHAPEQLSVMMPEAFRARFVARKQPRPGVADATVLVLRKRMIGDGMREKIVVHNLGDEDTAMTITLTADSDFADLFAVKAGRVDGGGCELNISDSALHLTDRKDSGRGLTVTATGDPVVQLGTMSWRIVVPRRGTWQTVVLCQPILEHRAVPMNLTADDEDSPTNKIRQWRATATRLTTGDVGLTAVLQRTESDLGALRMDDPADGTAYVAAGAPWFMALFGRDSLLTSWMALLLDSDLALGTLRQLAKLQGTQVDPVTEEEPGRIMHEMRHGPGGDQVLGGTVYFGTADATPLFVMLLAECWRWGVEESAIRELLPAADAALEWIDRFGDSDGDGFVEYRRKTDRGLANQGWKDSWDSISFADGHLAEPPIALCEVQAYTYAAKLGRAELAEAFGEKGRAARLRAEAEKLRERFDDAFWLPRSGWYAMALDGGKRQVDALGSNVAHCLWTGIVPDERAAQLIEHLGNADMDSGFGLRTLSSSMRRFNPMGYHNGSVWPHDTAIAVAGLLRYRHLPGAWELAERLAGGLTEAVMSFGARPPELYCGFGRSEFRSPVPYPTSCSPQAWASAAPLLLMRSFLGLTPNVPRRTLTVTPRLPERAGRVRLADLRLGAATVTIEAEGTSVTVEGLPGDWELIQDGAAPVVPQEIGGEQR
ncbi:amylo-alpha-1,6-glucosidase [Nocardia otitidiscaviarum]|uniref:Amylo-alpha-1,6-glucosidase n=1 Tax=Nocardia otitidiscaviarum TaxID=1823 RepID=A0A516NP82_9NOCA|nr:glycogen debranching N-terminal domain-containing protein [Nocardia otitidiscaviarum]MBF6183450.1 amylo-alpha-1,6-glucosidase [Nocardia otitidiscaviarum]MCP9624006.1 amylo-alpha-1,6-glucosidase [Nocardia otitidiscaviarum]QDP80723.1 amylo-alpha-1,6-glucosidase [Nocardia otitidiscaviarum]